MINKTKLALGIATATLTMTGAMVSPQAMAHTKAERVAEAANNKVNAMEAQLQAMQAELSSLRAAANRPAPSADAGKVQELDQWMTSVKSQPVKAKTKDNMVFFRGGYSHFNVDRGGTLDPTYIPGVGSNPDGLTVGSITDKDAWYFGAGFDFSLNDNLWGLMDKTEVLAELGVNYTQLGTKKSNGLSPQEAATVNQVLNNANETNGVVYVPAANTQTATVNMATVSASPKIKFLKGSAFRPWLIPVGFELNVISPPSNAITVLTPGMVFGTGIDYKVWKDLYVGADVRYHYAPGNVDGINTNNINAGGYVGIGF
jgi:hypothetical protein